MAILSVPIPDRPGVLADMTSTLGGLGINIEDLEIVHSAEGAKGTLHATVEEGAADDALAGAGRARATRSGGWHEARRRPAGRPARAARSASPGTSRSRTGG